jgi:hypothetical protein
MQTRMNVTAIVHRRAFMAASAATVLAPNFARAQAPVASDLGWATMTRADRNAAYNNNAAVSDREQITERWRTASARIRSQRPQHIDLLVCTFARAAMHTRSPLGVTGLNRSRCSALAVLAERSYGARAIADRGVLS